MLADQIERAKRLEQIKHLDAGEQTVAKEIASIAPHISLDAADNAVLAPFVKWCQTAQVRYLPAKPWVVAAFVMHSKQLGSSAEHIFVMLAAIAKAHDVHSLPNPTATAWVNSALANAGIQIDPPRSWSKEDKALWATLSQPIQQILARREQQRDTEVRRCQNLAAELKRQHMTAADTKPVESKKENYSGQTQNS